MSGSPQRQSVTILSFSRSGSSLLASILNRVCGIDFGESIEHQAPTAANPEGFWENEGIVRINDAALQAGGGSVFQPPPPNFCLELPRAVFEQTLHRMRRTIQLCSIGRSRFGWKDPRTAYTLPLWRLAAPALKAVIVVRDPVASAASFRSQHGCSIADASHLWFDSYHRIFLHSAGMERHAISFEALLANPVPVVQSIGRFLDVELGDEEIAAGVSQVIRPELIRFRSRLEPPLYSPTLDASAKLFYHVISPALAELRQPDYAALGSVLNGLVTFQRMYGPGGGLTVSEADQLDRYADAARGVQALVAERDAEIDRLNAALERCQALLEERGAR